MEVQLSGAEPPEKRAKGDWKQAWAIADGNNASGAEAAGANELTCPVCNEPESQQTDGNGMRLCCIKCGFVFDNIPDDRPDFGG